MDNATNSNVLLRTTNNNDSVKDKNATAVQFYIGSTLKLRKRMAANLKKGNSTTIGTILKTVAHGAVSVYILNHCANFQDLEKLAKNHTFPMIAVNRDSGLGVGL